VFFTFSLSHTSKYTAAGTMVNTHTEIHRIFILILYIMLEKLIIISVFLVLAFQDSVSLKDNPILEKLDVKRAALLEPHFYFYSINI
jgi:hypothetical protein